MKTATQIWGLWDCEELLSVHLTHDDAFDARDEHLLGCRCFTDEQNLIGDAVQIRAIRLPADIDPVENPVLSSRSGDHEQTVVSPAETPPGSRLGGGRHAVR